MYKRGQVTGFIIVGAVIIALALLFVYIGGFDEIKRVSLDRFSPIELFIQECLDDTAENVVLHNMRQGGYNNVYADGVDMGDYVVPYYLIDGVVFVPDKEDIENELGIGLHGIDGCLDFSVFEEFSFEKGENEFDVTVLDENIMVNAIIPVKASFNDVTRNFDVFKTVLDVDLNNLLGASLEYLELQKSDLNATFVGGLGDIAFDRDLDFRVINIEDDVVYSFIDGKLRDEDLIIMFGVRE